MIDIKLIRLITGEEIIAEVVDWKNGILTVKNGLTIIPHQDQVGFAPWATVISKENPEITISKTHLVYVAEVQEDVCKKYNEMFGSKLITPDSKKLIV